MKKRRNHYCSLETVKERAEDMKAGNLEASEYKAAFKITVQNLKTRRSSTIWLCEDCASRYLNSIEGDMKDILPSTLDIPSYKYGD